MDEMPIDKRPVKWVALFPPSRPGSRWFFNVGFVGIFGCGDLADTASDAPVEVAMQDFRWLLREEFDVQTDFDFVAGTYSWGATFF